MPPRDRPNINLRLANIEAEIHESTLDQRPRNTTKAYQPKQAEFLRWCRSNQIDDTVNSAKLLVFLQDNVVGRKRKKRGRPPFRREEDFQDDEHEHEDQEETEEEQESARQDTIGASVIKQYVNAITDLWRTQQAHSRNNHPLNRQNEGRIK